MGRCRGWSITAVVLAAAGSAAFWGTASAVRLQGTSATAAYVQKVAKGGTGDDFENRTRLFERIRFDLLDLGNPDLSFHTLLTARNDVTNQRLQDTRTRLYAGYLEYRPAPRSENNLRYSLRFGRQWVQGGVGSGTLDGFAAQTDHPRWGGLTVFGGTLGIDSREQLRLDAPKDSRRLGAELRIRPRVSEAAIPEVSVSFADTRRNDRDESRRLGARGSLRIRRQLRFWSEVRHDFLLDRTYGTAAGVEFIKPERGLRIWGEWNRHTTALPATSFFAFFDQKPIAELRGGTGFGLGGAYRLSVDFSRTDFKRQARYVSIEDKRVSRARVDRATSYRMVLQRGSVQLGGRIESGFGGDRASLVASASQEIGTCWRFDLDVGIQDYDFGHSPLDDNSAASGLLAATYKMSTDTRITAQLEGLNNRDLKHDMRLLARVDQRFRLGR